MACYTDVAMVVHCNRAGEELEDSFSLEAVITYLRLGVHEYPEQLLPQAYIYDKLLEYNQNHLSPSLSPLKDFH